MTETDDFADLPEDPELQFVEFERRLRKQMWDNLGGETSYSFDQDQKVYYITRLMAFHDAFEFGMLTRPALPRRSGLQRAI